MWPKVVSHKAYSGLNIFHPDLLRLGATTHRPREIAQRSCHTQHVRRALRPPLPLTAIQRLLSPMLELPEALKSLGSLSRQWDIAWGEVTLATGSEVDDARQGVDNFRFDLAHFVRQRPIGRVLWPGKKDPRIHPVEIPIKRSSKFVRLQATHDSDQ